MNKFIGVLVILIVAAAVICGNDSWGSKMSRRQLRRKSQNLKVDDVLLALDDLDETDSLNEETLTSSGSEWNPDSQHESDCSQTIEPDHRALPKPSGCHDQQLPTECHENICSSTDPTVSSAVQGEAPTEFHEDMCWSKDTTTSSTLRVEAPTQCHDDMSSSTDNTASNTMKVDAPTECHKNMYSSTENTTSNTVRVEALFVNGNENIQQILLFSVLEHDQIVPFTCDSVSNDQGYIDMCIENVDQVASDERNFSAVYNDSDFENVSFSQVAVIPDGLCGEANNDKCIKTVSQVGSEEKNVSANVNESDLKNVSMSQVVVMSDELTVGANEIVMVDSQHVDDSSVDSQINTEEENIEEGGGRRKKKQRPHLWKRNKTKARKDRGKSYISTKGKFVPDRKMQEANCTSRKCKLKCEEKITEQQRKVIFKHYWKRLADYNRQQEYLGNHIKSAPVKRQTCGTESRRNSSAEYSLTVNGVKIKVCRSFFLRTLAETPDRIRYHRESKLYRGGGVKKDKRGRHNLHKKIAESERECIREHIRSFPAVPSHYCRKKSKRKYLPQGLNIKNMYRQYVKKCDSNKIIPQKECIYRQVFCSDFNLGFHIPKKDQCSTCKAYQTAKGDSKVLLEHNYRSHVARKEEARQQKETDSLEATKKRSLITASFDLQKVLYCPAGKVGQIFYRRKLASYNFTVFLHKEFLGTCYMWDETSAKRGSNEIASCLWRWLSSLPAYVKEVRFYSDNCPGQNRNQAVSCMFLCAVQMLPVNTIHHKFLECGHTQMEVDSMHACIERKAASVDVNIPKDWATVASLAKQTGSSYIVNEIKGKEMTNWKEISQDVIINKTKCEDGSVVKWKEIRWMKYAKAEPDTIQFKYNFSTQFSRIKVRRETKGRKFGRKQLEAKIQQPLYNGTLPISKEKFNDLQALCKTGVIAEEYHAYYQNLPTSTQRADTLDDTDAEDSDPEET